MGLVTITQQGTLMTNIDTLISACDRHSFDNQAQAQAFLNQYSLDDQAAIVNALYIGRDHIHYNAVRPEDETALMNGELNRYYHTGGPMSWDIQPIYFASILHEKNGNKRNYFDAFRRCMPPAVIQAF